MTKEQIWQDMLASVNKMHDDASESDRFHHATHYLMDVIGYLLRKIEHMDQHQRTSEEKP